MTEIRSEISLCICATKGQIAPSIANARGKKWAEIDLWLLILFRPKVPNPSFLHPDMKITGMFTGCPFCLGLSAQRSSTSVQRSELPFSPLCVLSLQGSITAAVTGREKKMRAVKSRHFHLKWLFYNNFFFSVHFILQLDRERK